MKIRSANHHEKSFDDCRLGLRRRRGIQADLKTFAAHGVFGMSVITAITAQNTLEVLAVQDVLPEIIARQIEAIFEDMGADAVKVGMVSQPETIRTIVVGLRNMPLHSSSSTL